MKYDRFTGFIRVTDGTRTWLFKSQYIESVVCYDCTVRIYRVAPYDSIELEFSSECKAQEAFEFLCGCYSS